MCALAALGICSALGAAPLTPPVASYEISCRLDTETKTITGSQVVTWTNTTTRPAATLQFHLYLNAFRNTRSTFWREHGGRRRARTIPDSWGSIEVTRAMTSDGADLLPGMRYLAPDDGNPDDRTVAEYDLPRPVLPRQSVSVSMDFVSILPRASLRTGSKGDFFLVAQWFPKIGVFEETGWNCHQFHSNSEFFADFGDYDVSIDVPVRYRGKVGATGTRVSEREAREGRVVARFRQESVHDFAWAADPDFRVLSDHFRDPGLSDVEILLHLQPEHLAQADRHFRAVKAALSGYGRVLGPYPYPTLTVVDPPWGASGAGGMEYPTFITAGTSLFAPPSLQSPEEVTVHESGHQYFYGLIASNEFEEPWLDEGLNTYMTERVMKAVYGDYYSHLPVFGVRFPLGIEVRRPVDSNRRYFEHATEAPLGVPSWKYLTRESYGAIVYSKTALALATIERIVGIHAMDRALRLYSDRWRFGHPKGKDFVAAVAEATGRRDVPSLFERTFFSSGTVDYAVSEATSGPARPPRGLSDGKQPAARRKGYDTLVTVTRRGDVGLPVDVLLRFEGASSWRSSWDGQARWKRFRVEGGPLLVEAVVDPDEKILLDGDRTNNGRRPEHDPRAASRWTARAVFWLQNLFDFATVAW